MFKFIEGLPKGGARCCELKPALHQFSDTELCCCVSACNFGRRLTSAVPMRTAQCCKLCSRPMSPIGSELIIDQDEDVTAERSGVYAKAF